MATNFIVNGKAASTDAPPATDEPAADEEHHGPTLVPLFTQALATDLRADILKVPHHGSRSSSTGSSPT